MGVIPSGHDTSVPGSNIPTHLDFFVKENKTHTFILKSDKLKRNIEKMIKKQNASIDWDFSAKNSTKIRVICELKHNTPNVYLLSKKWQSTVEASMNEIMQDFTGKKLDILQDFWPKFIKRANDDLTHLSEKKKDVLNIYRHDNNKCIEIIGLKDEVEFAILKLQQVLKALEEEADIAKRIFTEEIKMCKRRQIDLLLQLKIFEKIKTSFNVEPSYDLDKIKISLTGLIDQIRPAKMHLFNAVNNFAEKSVKIDQVLTNILMKEDEVRKELHILFENDFRIVGWDLEDNLFNLCGQNNEDVSEALKIFSKNLISIAFSVDTSMQEVIEKEKWKQKHNKNADISLQTDGLGIISMVYSGVYKAYKLSGQISSPVIAFIEENFAKIVFYGMATPVTAVEENIKQYLMEKAIYENFFTTSLGKAKMVAKNLQSGIRDIEDMFKNYGVTIRVHTDENLLGIALRGKIAALENAKVNVKNLIQGIYKDTYSIKDEAMVKFLLSEKGQVHMHGLETKYSVIIMNAEDEKEVKDNATGETGIEGELCSVSVDTIAKDDVKRIYVVKGNLALMKCDAIVNAANENLQLGGGLAGDIKKYGNEKNCY